MIALKYAPIFFSCAEIMTDLLSRDVQIASLWIVFSKTKLDLVPNKDRRVSHDIPVSYVPITLVMSNKYTHKHF